MSRRHFFTILQMHFIRIKKSRVKGMTCPYRPVCRVVTQALRFGIVRIHRLSVSFLMTQNPRQLSLQ